MGKTIATCWDDGLVTDMPLISILDRLNIKATFALTPGRYTKTRVWNSNDQSSVGVCIPLESVFGYNHHDIWSHSSMHIRHDPNYKSDYITAKSVLEKIFNRQINGFCFPYGDINYELVAAAKSAGYTWLRAGRKSLPYLYNHVIYPKHHWRDHPDVIRQTVSRDGFAIVVGHTYELRTIDDWNNLFKWYQNISAEATTMTELCINNNW